MAAERRMDAREILDTYFLETRARLLEIAANLDRIDRADGAAALRVDAQMTFIRNALDVLRSETATPDRAERIQRLYSKE